MPKIALIAKLTAAEGKADELRATLASLIDAATEEAGLEVYAAHSDGSDPDVVWFYELYAGDEALDVHGRGERMKPAMKALGSLMAGRPEVHKLSPIVAKGLDV
jgi:quinol monooxygenase YgiN